MYSAPYPLNLQSHVHGKRIHLGVCGSIAAYRALDLVRWWKSCGVHVSATLTDAGRRFISPLSFQALGANPVYTNMWDNEQIFGHLEPGQHCHAFVIAPASAATLAHLANGNANTLLACQCLAFEGKFLVAPAMNPRMWQHSATQKNIKTLQERGVIIINPDTGGTACGDTGQGRLADLRYIWLMSLKALTEQDMAGKKILITLGPTRERWDAVRFWSNPSTGIMGISLAIAAWLRGATVHAICGPIQTDAGYFPPDSSLQRYDVENAEQMFSLATHLWNNNEMPMDMGIFTAAVADFSPKAFSHGFNDKYKKNATNDELCIHFTPNKDILLTIAKDKKPKQKILGFAAEAVHGEECGVSIEQIHAQMQAAVRLKLQNKGADILAGNNICSSDCGFGSITNSMYVADRLGREEIWPNLSKFDVAWRLCSWLMQM